MTWKSLFFTKGSKALERLITLYVCDLWMQEDHHKREQICGPFIATKNHRLSFLIFTKKKNHHHFQPSIGNFILSVGWLLCLFSSMNILTCPIIHNRRQISSILKVFYGDIGVYFYVCIKIIFTIYYIYHKYIFVCILILCMYVYCSYNEYKN
jgi:hypothetical protein